MRVSRSRFIWLALVAVLAAGGRDAFAQLKGSYPPGFAGLQAGSQPPPGILVLLPAFAYATSTIKNDEGGTVGAHPNLVSVLLAGGVAWVTPIKLFGGFVGGSALPLGFLKNSIEGARIDEPGSFGYADLFVQPLQLGWHFARADYVVGYSLFIPTGKYSFGATDNAGLGMYSHDLQAGTTVRFGENHSWHSALLATYELHGEKKGTEIRVGDILTLEGGTGRTMIRKFENPLPVVGNIGVVYYAQFKVREDHSPILGPLLAGRQDRVYGVGGEFNMIVPWAKLVAGLRVVGEFGARNRTQGIASVLTLSYQAASFKP